MIQRVDLQADKLREVYFLLEKDSSAITNNPNAIIRLSDSNTVIASPPFQEMCRPPLTSLFYCTHIIPHYHLCANIYSTL